MARNDTDWSVPQPSARQEREAEQLAREIEAAYAGVTDFDYGPAAAPAPAYGSGIGFDAARAAGTAGMTADKLAALQSISNIQQTLGAMAGRDLQRQQLAADDAALLAAIRAEEQQRAMAQRSQAMARNAFTVGMPAMGFTGQMLAGGVSPGLLQARYGTSAPAVEQYLGRTIPGGLGQGVLGMLGFKTAQQHLATGTGQPVMDATGRVRGALSTGPFGGVVYSGTRIPGYEGEYADLIRPASETGIRVGYNEDDGGGQPQVVAPVEDTQQCPDGYVFDEDLQACRLETTAPVATPIERPSPVRTYSLLDQAPDGLLEFQRRYGLPEQQMGFSLLT